MHVLIAIDGSPGALEAVRQVGPLLAPNKDTVAFYYSPPAIYLATADTLEADVQERARQALAAAIFAHARLQLPVAFRTATHEIIGTQDPRHGILAAADNWRADLIVVGARGLGPLKKLLLGSVSSAIVHAAKVPVMVVRAKSTRQAESELRVLLACDTRHPDQHLVSVASLFHWPNGTIARTVTVVEAALVGQIPEWLEEQARSTEIEPLARHFVEAHDRDLQTCRQHLEALQRRLPTPFHNVMPIIREGHPSKAILEVIASEQSDLVIVGTMGGGALARWLLGSTSEAILDHAPCSVLIVPTPPRP